MKHQVDTNEKKGAFATIYIPKWLCTLNLLLSLGLSSSFRRLGGLLRSRRRRVDFPDNLDVGHDAGHGARVDGRRGSTERRGVVTGSKDTLDIGDAHFVDFDLGGVVTQREAEILVEGAANRAVGVVRLC